MICTHQPHERCFRCHDRHRIQSVEQHPDGSGAIWVLLLVILVVSGLWWLPFLAFAGLWLLAVLVQAFMR